MPATKATDNITEQARAIMMRGFAQGWAVVRIVQAISDDTGEQLSPRTVARRAQEWRAEVSRRQEARERVGMIVAAAKENGFDGSQIIQALATDHLFEHPEALTGADPIEIQTLNLKAEELRIKRRQLAIREREVAAVERRAQLAEEKEKRALEALADHGEAISPEQRVEKIREIYGLTR